MIIIRFRYVKFQPKLGLFHLTNKLNFHSVGQQKMWNYKSIDPTLQNGSFSYESRQRNTENESNNVSLSAFILKCWKQYFYNSTFSVDDKDDK